MTHSSPFVMSFLGSGKPLAPKVPSGRRIRCAFATMCQETINVCNHLAPSTWPKDRRCRVISGHADEERTVSNQAREIHGIEAIS